MKKKLIILSACTNEKRLKPQSSCGLGAETNFNWVSMSVDMRIKLKEICQVFYTNLVRRGVEIMVEEFYRSRWKKAVRVYLQGFEQDSLDEQVCRHLMICYQRSGRKSDAAATYKYLCDQLERRVARQPSSKTRQLVESILHS